MFAKACLYLTLLGALFLSTQVFPFTSAAELTRRNCAKMECARSCCANTACCVASEQHGVPKPIHEASSPEPQLAAIQSRNVEALYLLAPAAPSFVISDDAHAGHAPPRLAVNCIRLI